MFYIFYSAIAPNTASGNRFLSFLRGFDELGINVTAVLHNPSTEHYHIQSSFTHVIIMELWEDWPFFRRVADKLYSKFSLVRFLNKLQKGDSVFLYGSPEYVNIFRTIPGVTVYHERTEHPEVLPLSSNKLQEQYIQACAKLDGLFVISTALKDYFISRGVQESKITIVNMTVDTERFKDVSRNNNGGRIISYCGTASNNKDGVDQLIKAFAIVARRHQDVKLQIIGKAPSEDDASGNAQLVKQLGIENRVIFTGVVSAYKMPQILVNSTILALDRPDSLQARNGFPTKLGEYLLSERPVVVTKVGDIPLFLKDGESALLAEDNNPEDFASKICWLLEHPAEADEIGKAGAQVAKTHFNYKIETKKIASVIFSQQ